jgi:Bacterial type II and III secretion system protein
LTPNPVAAPGQPGADTQDQAGLAAGNPLLGGLGGALDQTDTSASTATMRIIPNNPNNAILIYGTPEESGQAEAMLRKIDILPLQVLIEAVIAEVTLNDDLRYGTQFFFKSHNVNIAFSNFTGNVVAPLAATPLLAQFPGLVGGGQGPGGAPFVISALQAVTKVNVLSSPQILVTDNHPARLQVGSLVPYLTGSSTSNITPNAPTVNSIDYRETGVITEVTPRVQRRAGHAGHLAGGQQHRPQRDPADDRHQLAHLLRAIRPVPGGGAGWPDDRPRGPDRGQFLGGQFGNSVAEGHPDTGVPVRHPKQHTDADRTSPADHAAGDP